MHHQKNINEFYRELIEQFIRETRQEFGDKSVKDEVLEEIESVFPRSIRRVLIGLGVEKQSLPKRA